MPTAVATKIAMNGTKRKGAPTRDAGTKENKKLKFNSRKKSATKTTKVKPKTAKKVREQGDSDDFADFGSDGGAPLHREKSTDSNDLEESDTTEFSSDSNAEPPTKDSVHPDRAKAAAANSKHFEWLDIYNTYN